MELYAMPAATATLLDDAAVNIDEWIASEVELTFDPPWTPDRISPLIRSSLGL